MKKTQNLHKRLPFLVIIILGLLFCLSDLSQARCLIQGRSYELVMEQENFQGPAGRKIPIKLEIKPDRLPSGCFISSRVKQIQGPAPAEITTGFPEIFITCPTPGEYKFSITTSLVIKSSCAGVSSCTLDPVNIVLSID